MNEAATETLSVVVEREIPYPPEKIWRALTQPHLIEAWLMKNDFKPVVGHGFTLRGDWGSVVSSWLAYDHPVKDETDDWQSGVMGLHLNMMGLRPGIDLKTTKFSADEQAWLAKMGSELDDKVAYQRIHATRPQTLGVCCCCCCSVACVSACGRGTARRRTVKAPMRCAWCGRLRRR